MEIVTEALAAFPRAIGEVFAMQLGLVVVLGGAGILAGLFLQSAAGVRFAGKLQRWRTRLLGSPKPKLVERAADGSWRPLSDPRHEAREKRAGRILYWLMAGLAMTPVAIGVLASCTHRG